jgi:predicted nucleic acid-binding protein
VTTRGLLDTSVFIASESGRPVRLQEQERRINVHDLWIAAAALAHDMPVVSQDADFDVLEELDLLGVIRV